MSEDGERAEALARRKRVRAGHRGSVTRILNQLSETGSADVSELKQMKQSLLEKSDILAKLDGELIEVVDEDHLEMEIEQAVRLSDVLVELCDAAERPSSSLDPDVEGLASARFPREWALTSGTAALASRASSMLMTARLISSLMRSATLML